MNRLRTLVTVSSLALGVAACGAEVPTRSVEAPLLQDSSVVVTVLDVPARPGRAVRVRFENRTDLRVFFHPCDRRVERQDGDGWQPHPPELRLCTAMVFPIAAGEQVVEPVDVPADVAPGTYRFVFPASQDGRYGQISLVSRPFEVQSGL